MATSFQPWMLPEGVIESLPLETQKIDYLERQAIDAFSRWGYQRVRPPIMEYLDALITDSSAEDLLEQTIQFKDQVSGKQLGIRADITPQVARIDAHYLKTDNVSRYAYAGDVVRSYPTGHGNFRNPTIAGVELFGSNSWQADVEVVSLLIEFLEQVGVRDFVLDLGNMDIAVELLLAFKVEENRFSHYFDALLRKDREAISVLAKKDKLDTTQCNDLLALTQLHGGIEVLKQAEEYYANYPKVLLAIGRLQKIVEHLIEYTGGTNFSFDLGELRTYGYHNGLIFSVYQVGQWQTLARGGRYDNIGVDFVDTNFARAATGFSCNLNVISRLISAPKDDRKLILCRLPLSSELQKQIKQYRKNDIVVHAIEKGSLPKHQFSHELIINKLNQFELITL